MKLLIPLFALATVSLAQEIESVPQEKALAIARKLITTLGTPADAPVATDVDTDKAVSLKAGQAGLLAMPDKKLTSEALAAAGKEPLVIGQLWMHKVVPAVQKTAPSPDKLRSITVDDGDKQARAEVYFLSAAKTEAGTLELSLFSKDKTALVKVPLTKTDATASTTPLALSGAKDDDNTGTLTITVFGSYKADVTVTRPQE